jgi:hypothetical protein
VRGARAAGGLLAFAAATAAACIGDQAPAAPIGVRLYVRSGLADAPRTTDGWALTFRAFTVVLAFPRLELADYDGEVTSLGIGPCYLERTTTLFGGSTPPPSPLVIDLTQRAPSPPLRTWGLSAPGCPMFATSIDSVFEPLDDAVIGPGVGPDVARTLESAHAGLFFDVEAARGEDKRRMRMALAVSGNVFDCAGADVPAVAPGTYLDVTLVGDPTLLFALTEDDAAPVVFDPFAQADVNGDGVVDVDELAQTSVAGARDEDAGAADANGADAEAGVAEPSTALDAGGLFDAGAPFPVLGEATLLEAIAARAAHLWAASASATQCRGRGWLRALPGLFDDGGGGIGVGTVTGEAFGGPTQAAPANTMRSMVAPSSPLRWRRRPSPRTP